MNKTNFILGLEFDKLHEVPRAHQKPNQTSLCTANIAAFTGIPATHFHPVGNLSNIFRNL